MYTNSKKARAILHVLFPTKCPICGALIDYMDSFCSECPDKLTRFTGDFHIEGTERFYASFEYDDKISPAIMLLKDGINGSADYALGNALADTIFNAGAEKLIDIIIPVPMHKKDMRSRGFNQAELIANQLSERLNIPYNFKCVRKIRQTRQQKLLSKDERSHNLSGAFSIISPELIKDKNVLLVDDVCTTGATLAEITALLKSSGANKVYCACCCKTPLQKNDKGGNDNEC